MQQGIRTMSGVITLAYIVLLLTSVNRAWAQSKEKRLTFVEDRYSKFRNYYRKDGLCSYLFTDITQDKLGFLWLATQEGLMRFDGYKFTTYLNNTDTTSLPSSNVTSLAVDSAGILWVSTVAGLCHYNPEMDNFQRVQSFFGQKLQGNMWIRKLCVDSQKRLWIDDADGYLTRVDFDNRIVIILKHESQRNADYIQHTLKEVDGYLYGGGANASFFRVRLLSETPAIEYLKTVSLLDPRKCPTLLADILPIAGGGLLLADYRTNCSLFFGKQGMLTSLPFSGNYSLCDNGDGRIWLGGYFGACLLDLKTRVASRCLNDDTNPQSIAGGEIYKTFRDSQGVIWFAATKGLSALSPHLNRVTHVRKMGQVGGLASNEVTCLLPDGDSILWVGTTNRGLIRMNTKSLTFETHSYDRTSEQTISSNRVTSIAKLDRNNLLVSLWDGRPSAINRFSIRQRQFTRYNTCDGNYSWYSRVVCLSSGSVFVGSWGAGVFNFSPKNGDYVGRHFSNFDIFPPNGVCLECQVVGTRAGVWINGGTDPSYIDYQGEPYRFISGCHYPGLTPNPIPTVSFYTRKSMVPVGKMVTDRNGALYQLVDSNQVLRFNPLNQQVDECLSRSSMTFQRLLSDKDLFLVNGEGLYYLNIARKNVELVLGDKSMRNICSVLQLDENRLLVGGNQGVFLLSLNEKKWRKERSAITSPTNRTIRVGSHIFCSTDTGLIVLNSNLKAIKTYLPNQQVRAMTLDSLGRVWLATDRNLFRMEETTGHITQVQANPEERYGLPSDRVYALTTDHQGYVWIVNEGVVVRFDPRSQWFERMSGNSPRSIMSPLTTMLEEDSHGYLWAGYSDGTGIDRINLKTGYIDHYGHLTYDSTSFPKAYVNCLIEDGQGRILVGTDHGLAQMQSRSNHFQLITKKNGLPSNKVNALCQDVMGYLWVGSDNGLVRYDQEKSSIAQLSLYNGLAEECITAIVRLPDGRLAVGGDGGIALLNPKVVQRDSTEIPVLITQVTLEGRRIALDRENLNPLQLESKNHSLVIDYTAIDFRAPENIRYAYKLIGFDDSLHRVDGLSRSVHYTFLPAGTYEFQVFATNANGVWGKRYASLKVHVKRPFWQSPWFILWCMLLLGGLVYLSSWLWSVQARMEANRLEQEVEHRTKDLVVKNERLSAQQQIISRQSEYIRNMNALLTDDIASAHALQQSVMPSHEYLHQVLGDFFLHFKPLEQVSGDFYWVVGDLEKFTLAVGDCMGHGVYGGFQSILGLSLIAEAALHCSMEDTRCIVQQIHDRFRTTLKSESESGNSNSTGMDLLVCTVDRKNMRAWVSGARLPLYILRWKGNGYILIKYQLDKFPLGSSWFKADRASQEIHLQPNDMIYIATDGVFDQLSENVNYRFTRPRFEQTLQTIAHLPLLQQQTFLLEELAQCHETKLQTDDITIIAFRV